MSSLATQLAQNASLNANILVDRSRRKPTVSYLFTGKSADEHDLETIYAVAINSLLSLASIEPKLEKYEETLFSEQAKETDRTLLRKDVCEELDKQIVSFLWALGPYLLEPPTGKILEWLVRRFRIQEFNLEGVLALFLPYHESPHFAKMVTLLNIKPNTTWSFLLSYKSAGQKLPRVSLVTEMLKNPDLARFVVSLLPKAIKKKQVHRTLIAFNAATLYEFITRSKILDEGTIAYLLPALLAPLQQKAKYTTRDAVLGSNILLAALSRKCEISTAALKLVINAMVSSAHTIQEDQLVDSLVAVCEPQDELPTFSEEMLEKMLSIQNIERQLVSSSSWRGSEKMLRPLIHGLVTRLHDQTSQALLETFISATNLPNVLVEDLTTRLLEFAVQPEPAAEFILAARRLLSLIHQRFPEVLRLAADALVEEDDSMKDTVEQLTFSLNTVNLVGLLKPSTTAADFIILASSADAKVRIAAIKQLLGTDDDTNDLEITRGVLAARLQDTDATVIEALYDTPEALTSIFSSDSKIYVDSLAAAISSQTKTKRNILRLHLSYISSHFWKSAEIATKEEIFGKIFFPFLLVTKSRQKSVEVVWEAVEDLFAVEENERGMLGLLEGCADFVTAKDGEGADSVEVMNQINFAVTSKISGVLSLTSCPTLAKRLAENIVKSAHFSKHCDFIILQLQHDIAHVKLMAYLIMLAVIKNTSGVRQLELATQVIDTMAMEQLSGVDDFSQEHLALEKPDDTSFGKYIVTKPHSRVALHWIQISIIAAISRIQAPKDTVIDWVAPGLKDAKDPGHLYVSVVRSVYDLANASTSLPILSSALLQLLFLNLQDNALAFLAGMWLAGAQGDFKNSTIISLLHAAAFLEAHVLEDDGVDFQTILPSLLVALQSSNEQVSRGALECISRVRILAGKSLTSVYQFDVIYGQTHRTLQYLDQKDMKRYLDALAQQHDHLANDASYLKTFHQQYLAKAKGEKKKEHEYKHRVTCYLMSHANAVSSSMAQVTILQSLAGVSDKGKAQILLPTIQHMLERTAHESASASIFESSEELMMSIVSAFDASSAELLNGDEKAWDVFLQVMQTYLRTGISHALQKVLAGSLTTGLFSSLKLHRQIALCEVLLDVGSSGSSSDSLARNILSAVLSDVSLVIRLLQSLQPVAPTASPRAIKRAKTSESPDVALPRLSLLVEILGTKPLPGSLDLISHFLDTLSKVVQILPSAQADVAYIEQLLMSAIESASSSIKEVPNITPSVIRIDVLVDVIRVSTNPQTFHQALLLISSLARLAPDSVLHNVMPVFTFMGSNVLHRDDSYSFKVVQKTIDGLVPVMVSSLKKDSPQPLDLYISAKDFLRVFTDAASHIPRHRRNKFFSHLINVLGSRDFLAPLCMLLLDKAANRIIRQSGEDFQHSLSVPAAVFQNAEPEVQLHTAVEVLKEAQRLVAQNVDSTTEPTFLEDAGDRSAASTSMSRKRAQALISFIGTALKPPKSLATAAEINIGSIITILISLAHPQSTLSDTKVDYVSEAARSSLQRLLSSMSVVDFITSVKTTLESVNTQVQSGALELVGKRVPSIAVKTRPTISKDINQILASIKNILNVHKTGNIVDHALESVTAIATTMCPGEEGSLMDLVPHLLASAQQVQTMSKALPSLAALSGTLGPRIIPFFRQIISQCVTILRGSEQSLFEDALSTLQGLLKSIPSFWGVAEISQIIDLYADQFSSSARSLLQSLIKGMTKKIPSKTLVPALLNMWTILQPSGNMIRISAFFDALRRAMQQCDRPTILEHLRPLFKCFLEAFDIVKLHQQPEEHVIQAFKELVVKLNETSFKPLFRRLHDWAFTGDSDEARKTTFNRLYISLLDFFKGLMVPYMSFLLAPFCDLLKDFKEKEEVDYRLWSSGIQVFTKTLSFDDLGFWRDDKLRQILQGLSNQVETCARLGISESRVILQNCLSAFLETVTDDFLAKTLNLNILMHTRSDDVSVRIFALSCAERLWRVHGGKLLGFVAETATFIAECGEDENDLVVKESFRLKDAVESVAGKIDGL
ncbi:hypothetical protein CPB83DRAFT_877003 [Crepidotus variabilis]|uniref:U3 small nucleolar RNA-associated protein 10 n=1 Tax=Crepidotus variabilis TaxID=179855 RepID=A0A9P6EAY3_9AGAR|nr:hypothetical protein CPB83DRAFT_877003 [Crepidotus variabilis]